VSVGQTLREARERTGRSVDEVSQATRIRAAVIRAIEDDNFAPCGGDVYARGHIRSIAAVVGANAEELIAEYDATHHASRVSVSESLEAEVADVRASQRRGPSWAAAAAVVLIALIVYGVVQLVTPPASSGPGIAAPSSSATAPSAPAPVAPAPTPSASSSPEVIAARESVSVVVDAARRASWIRVTDSAGQTVFEGLLNPGDRQEFSDPTELSFVIGDAGAVDLTVNGESVGAPGADGAVVRVSFGPDDPAAG